MCIAIGAASAAAVGQATSLAISAVGTIAGIAQAQQQAAFAQQQANLQLQQQRQQTEVSNQRLANQYASETAAQQAKRITYEKDLLNNMTAAQKSYQQEQVKLDDARAKAAFNSSLTILTSMF